MANEISYNSLTDKSKYEIIELSRDHKPELPDEKERILSYDGRIERYIEGNIQ